MFSLDPNYILLCTALLKGIKEKEIIFHLIFLDNLFIFLSKCFIKTCYNSNTRLGTGDAVANKDKQSLRGLPDQLRTHTINFLFWVLQLC